MTTIGEIKQVMKSNEFWKLSSNKRMKIWNKLRDLEYKESKERIYFRLTGSSKYYYADKCSKFAKIFEGKKYRNNNIVNAVKFEKNSITLVMEDTSEYDFKRFESSRDLLNFVDGYVEAIYKESITTLLNSWRCNK